MSAKVTGTGLTLTMLILAGFPAYAQVSAASGNAAQVPGSAPAVERAPGAAYLLVPAEFKVPTLVETASFKLVPLGPELVKLDYDAYMSSIEHLQKTFTRSSAWPHKDVSDADAMRDMEAEQARFRKRESFAYAVLTPDGSRERGCVYVYSSTVAGYDAVVRMWVTKDEHDAGFDAELHKWVADWIRKDWPFAKVAYPGRTIEWGTWDALVAANKARKAASR
jgi:hypothetical protein